MTYFKAKYTLIYGRESMPHRLSERWLPRVAPSLTVILIKLGIGVDFNVVSIC
jgi:hypothetical protein